MRAIGPFRILVADDAVDIAEGLSTLFKAMGHATSVAIDGVAALDAAHALQPDLVVLDLDMPSLNGYEVARAIRLDVGIRHPFLIALTASHGVAVEVATKAVGFDAYMRKPADTYALIAIVTDLASRV